MANTFSPFGFRPFGQLEGTAPTAGMDRMWIASSDTNSYYTGDLVALSSAQGFGTNPNTISPYLNAASSAYSAAGVFVGCKYYSATVGRTVWNSYFPASVGSSSPCEAYVITNPQQMFLAQASTTSGVVGTSMLGFGITVCTSLTASGNTTTGQSYQALASSGTTIQSASMPFRVVDVYSNYAPPGVNGTSTTAEGGAYLIVRPNFWMRNTLNQAST